MSDGRILVVAGLGTALFGRWLVDGLRGRPGDVGSRVEMPELLRPRGQVGHIGPETGRLVRNGMTRWTSFVGPRYPTSYRYVLVEDWHVVAALQILTLPGSPREGRIMTVMTRPDRRRQGLARRLLERARQDFDIVRHATRSNMSPAGLAWATAVGGPIRGEPGGSLVRPGPRLRAPTFDGRHTTDPLTPAGHVQVLRRALAGQQVWDPVNPVLVAYRNAAIHHAQRDLSWVLGRDLRVATVSGRRGDDDDMEEFSDVADGFRVRILPSSDHDILGQWTHQGSTRRLDPLWWVEILEGPSGLQWTWTPGRSYVMVAP